MPKDIGRCFEICQCAKRFISMNLEVFSCIFFCAMLTVEVRLECI